MSHERDWGEIGLGCLGLLALMVIIVIVSAFITSVLWGAIVPEVFPTAVNEELLPASLSIVQALKLSILFSFLGLTSASTKSKSKKSTYSSFGERVVTYIVAFVIMLPILAIMVVISGFLVSIIWGWVVPDVFNGAVKMGMLPAKLSIWHAILLSFLFSMLGLSNKRASSPSSDDD